jgi:nucleotide-binding universal stress UspA family protein
MWDPPSVVSLGLPPVVTDVEPLRLRAEAFPGAFVQEVLGDASGLTVVPSMVRGRAAQVLVDASEHAELLVIGSLGLGGLKGMVLGSVGHHCAAHSHCPVVIVHHDVKPGARKVRRGSLHASAAG